MYDKPIAFQSKVFSSSIPPLNPNHFRHSKSNLHSIESSYQSTNHKCKTICPPQDFKTKQNFDSEKFFDDTTYYCLYQNPQINQENLDDQANIMTTYQLKPRKNLWTKTLGRLFGSNDKKEIQITNANYDISNKKMDYVQLRGVPDPNSPSKAKVGPLSLPGSWLYGPYYVIEAGTYENLQNLIDDADYDQELNGNIPEKYEWAIISGGAPNYSTNDCSCTFSKDNKLSRNGLWILSKYPFGYNGVNESKVDKIFDIMKQKNIDTSNLKRIDNKLEYALNNLISIMESYELN